MAAPGVDTERIPEIGVGGQFHSQCRGHCLLYVPSVVPIPLIDSRQDSGVHSGVGNPDGLPWEIDGQHMYVALEMSRGLLQLC